MNVKFINNSNMQLDETRFLFLIFYNNFKINMTLLSSFLKITLKSFFAILSDYFKMLSFVIFMGNN